MVESRLTPFGRDRLGRRRGRAIRARVSHGSPGRRRAAGVVGGDPQKGGECLQRPDTLADDLHPVALHGEQGGGALIGGHVGELRRPAEEHETTSGGVEETEEQREILPIALVRQRLVDAGEPCREPEICARGGPGRTVARDGGEDGVDQQVEGAAVGRAEAHLSKDTFMVIG